MFKSPKKKKKKEKNYLLVGETIAIGITGRKCSSLKMMNNLVKKNCNINLLNYINSSFIISLLNHDHA